MSLEDELKAAALLDSGDFDEALLMLETMAAESSPYALLCLGWIYESGKIGDPNAEYAAYYYGKAVELEIPRGFFELGRLRYKEGRFVEARDLFYRGSLNENLQCLAWFGLMTARGLGGIKNVNEGINILRICASKGQLVAKRELCRIALQDEKSTFVRAAIHIRIAWIAILTFFETLRDPYSERGYR